ncbi:Ubiquitin carboxyl-terminal hydrolase 16 [Haplosporangium bisporale]|nr:Ubiquitin carboxyl-terminal hydrolase 16 [Haplosporangium bisporale]
MAKKKKGGRRLSQSDFADGDAMLQDILVGSANAKARAMTPPVPVAVPAAPTTSTIAPTLGETAEPMSTAELVPSIQESSHKPSVDKKCQHVKNAVKAPKFKKGLGHLKDWDHCQGCIAAEAKAKKLAKRQQQDSTEALEALSLDDADHSIEALDSESLWICLTCCEINCGRALKKHAIMHHEKNQHSHPLAINLGTMDCWCYECDAQIVPSKNRNETVKECQAIIETVLQIRQSKMRANSNTSIVIAPALTKAKISTPGLQNLGNTCFFNSVVQILTETKSLKTILSEDQEAQAQFPISLAARTDAGLGPLTSAFKMFLETMWKQQGATVAPRDLFMQICKKWKVFRGFRQQDSQELMRYLFDGIKQEELDLIKRQLAEEKGDQPEAEAVVETDASDTEKIKDQNEDKIEIEPPKYVPFIDTCFSGKLVSVIVCDSCKKCSYAYENFFDMSLPVKGPTQLAAGLSPKARLLAHSKPATAKPSELEISTTGTDADDNKLPIPESDLPSEAHLTHIRKLLRNVGQSNSEDLSILRSLNQFTAVDTLDGDNKFACENCFKLVRSSTTIPEEPKEADEIPELSSAAQESVVDPEAVKVEQEDQEEVQEVQEDSAADKKDEAMSETTEEAVHDAVNGTLQDSKDNTSESEESDESHEQVDRFGNTIPRKPSPPLKVTANKKKPEEEKFIFRKAYKRYLVSSLPSTLVLHLKRFEQSGRFGQMRKIEDHVEIPEELDMGPYFMPAKDVEEEGDGVKEGAVVVGSASKKYRLYGAVVHMGTLVGGHYTNYVLSSKVESVAHSNIKVSGKDESVEMDEDSTKLKEKKDPARQWIACSDTSVRHASLQEVLASRAYLLFYERIE